MKEAGTIIQCKQGLTT